MKTTTKPGTPKTPNRKPTTLIYADGREVKSTDVALADELRGAVAGGVPALEAAKASGVVAVRIGRQRRSMDIDTAIFQARWWGNSITGSFIRKMEAGEYTEIVIG